mmetsp:Transcript_10567/g.24856  ORF Transcript_10567/g.24856 Transcript_10567/m.24856 type:complete len:121 (+) Transcript_10567:1481-1843(+)
MVPCTTQRLSSAVSMDAGISGAIAPELIWPDALATQGWLDGALIGKLVARSLCTSFPKMGPTPGSSGREFARDGGSKGRCSHGWGALLREEEESRTSSDLPALSSPHDCPTCPATCRGWS